MRLKNERNLGGIFADIFVYSFLLIYAILILFPIYNVLILSVASFEHAAQQGLYLVPRSFTLDNYLHIFRDDQLINSVFVAARNVLFGTSMALVLTIFAGYVLSKKNLPGKRFLFTFMIITMFFSAGLIPWFMVMRSLGFVNSIWVMTIPNSLSVFNVILVRNYFMSLPESIEESAKLDGAGEFVIMWQIIVPMSKPIIATVTLFYAVGFWNEWWNAMLFLQDSSMHPLALLLRRMVIDNAVTFGDPLGFAQRLANPLHDRSLLLATVTVAMFPILCVYPFLQRYFTKGIILGAVKA